MLVIQGVKKKRQKFGLFWSVLPLDRETFLPKSLFGFDCQSYLPSSSPIFPSSLSNVLLTLTLSF